MCIKVNTDNIEMCIDKIKHTDNIEMCTTK